MEIFQQNSEPCVNFFLFRTYIAKNYAFLALYMDEVILKGEDVFVRTGYVDWMDLFSKESPVMYMEQRLFYPHLDTKLGYRESLLAKLYGFKHQFKAKGKFHDRIKDMNITDIYNKLDSHCIPHFNYYYPPSDKDVKRYNFMKSKDQCTLGLRRNVKVIRFNNNNRNKNFKNKKENRNKNKNNKNGNGNKNKYKNKFEGGQRKTNNFRKVKSNKPYFSKQLVPLERKDKGRKKLEFHNTKNYVNRTKKLKNKKLLSYGNSKSRGRNRRSQNKKYKKVHKTIKSAPVIKRNVISMDLDTEDFSKKDNYDYISNDPIEIPDEYPDFSVSDLEESVNSFNIESEKYNHEQEPKTPDFKVVYGDLEEEIKISEPRNEITMKEDVKEDITKPQTNHKLELKPKSKPNNKFTPIEDLFKLDHKSPIDDKNKKEKVIDTESLFNI